MAQTVRLTITPDLEKAIDILKHATTGTLNTTELIKLAVGELAQIKKRSLAQPEDITPQEMDKIGARLFFEWAKEDRTLHEDIISSHVKIKPFIPEPYVSNR